MSNFLEVQFNENRECSTCDNAILCKYKEIYNSYITDIEECVSSLNVIMNDSLFTCSDSTSVKQLECKYYEAQP